MTIYENMYPLPYTLIHELYDPHEPFKVQVLGSRDMIV